MKGAFGEFKGDLLGKIVVVGAERMFVDKGVRLYSGVTLHTLESQNQNSKLPPPPKWKIIIGENSIIQRDSQLSASQLISIGKNVVIADRTLIIDTTHGDFTPSHYTFLNGSEIPDVFLQNCQTRDYYSSGPVVIEDDVHIGMNCVIMPGVTIGHNSVISASTIVMKDVPPYSIVSSPPGKLVETFSI